MPAKRKTTKRATATKRKAPTRAKKPATKAKKPVSRAKKPATRAKAPTRAKKTVSRAKPTRKPAITAIKQRFSKTEILNSISDNTGLTRKEVGSVLGELETLISRHIKKGASGEFVMPGLFKIVTVKKPARPARWGVNPFTGEKMKFKAKPASIAVKVRPLKKMKEMAK